MRVKKSALGYVSASIGYGRFSKTWRLILVVFMGALLVSVPLVLNRSSHASPPCPCNVFTSSQPTTIPSVYNQAGGIEVGMRFKADQAGYISGARFYKVSGMTGTHTASLWDNMGNRIAQAIFTSESPTGWQQINFSPVAITANTIYTVSVYMADGNYTATPNFFTGTEINNSPLIAPSDTNAWDGLGNRGQGDYSAGASAYPTSYYNGGNYWVDVSYVASTSTAAPQVTAQTPVPNATNVPVGNVDIIATFDKSMDASTINSNTFLVKDSGGNPVAGTVSYNVQTYVATFTADTIWNTSSKYTVTLKGSGSPAMADMQGITLAADNVWSFTTSSAPLACPCTLYNRQNPAGSTTYLDSTVNNSELGTKIVPQESGYITALRFYKSIITPDTTHDGNIWDSNGNNLATVSFTNESEYGWQEATLTTPLYVRRGQVYVISYGMATGDYQALAGGFTSALTSPGLAAYPSGDSRNTTVSTGTANSVLSHAAGTYPNLVGGTNAYYYIDAVFSISPTDKIPPKVVVTQPTDKSYGVDHSAGITADFDQALNAATVNIATVQIHDSLGNLVAGTVSYNAGQRRITFQPASPLAYNSKYSVSISTGVKDLRGVNLAADVGWSFTTGSPVSSNMNQGGGGPILVLTTASNAYGNYYAEILRTEGFNYFDVKDISTLSATELAQYQTVLLSSMPLTPGQVSLLASWVNGGGNLVAMRPDQQLAGLLGLSSTGLSVTNQYLRTNVATPAGMGIVDTPIQFKGTADKYMVNDATTVANIYSDNATSSAFPAATMRTVGAGKAMAFTFDLAQSVIGLHQGNKAWSGMDRDGDTVIRSNDLFYGAMVGDVQPDWLDSTKMAIPQADEQQRLLANMITEAMKKSLPAPRFWYLPNNQKAALVMAGDDHAVPSDRGTEMILNNWLNESQTGCSVADWQCVRASHYVYPSAPLTTSRASQYIGYGFEVGDHPNNYNSCGNYANLAALNSAYAANLLDWRTVHPGLPFQNTSRYHCYLWGSWDMMPLADIANGIRYDLNTVALPSSWIGTNSPIVTGSGMNMRLTDINGAMIDVRQGVTNFDNTTAGTTSIAAAFDNALGPQGYYGIFGSHYDMSDTYNQTLYSVAKSRNVPIISSQQALTWLDGRSSSNFSNLKSLGTGKESFTINVAEGGMGLQAMVPVNDAGGTIASIQLNGQMVTYQTNVIKGEQYAIFAAQPGDYVVTYSDYTAPATTTTGSTPQPNSSPTTNNTVAATYPTVTSAATDQTSLVSDNQAPSAINPLTSASRSPEAKGTTKAVNSPLATAAAVAGAVAVLGGGGAGVWVAIKRFRLK